MHTSIQALAAAEGDTLTSWINQLFIDLGTAVVNGVKVVLIVVAVTIIYKSANKVLGAVLAAVVAVFGWWAINNFDNTGIGDKIDNQTAMSAPSTRSVDVVPGQVLHVRPGKR